MATRNIVPRATGEGQLGTSAKAWGAVYAEDAQFTGEVNAGSLNITGDLQVAGQISAGEGGNLAVFTEEGKLAFPNGDLLWIEEE